MLSQSTLVRQKMIALSMLCTLIARTAYSPFSIFTASDSISETWPANQQFLNGTSEQRRLYKAILSKLPKKLRTYPPLAPLKLRLNGTVQIYYYYYSYYYY